MGAHPLHRQVGLPGIRRPQNGRDLVQAQYTHIVWESDPPVTAMQGLLGKDIVHLAVSKPACRMTGGTLRIFLRQTQKFSCGGQLGNWLTSALKRDSFRAVVFWITCLFGWAGES